MIIGCLMNLYPIFPALHWTHKMMLQMIQVYSLIDDQKIGLTSLRVITIQDTCQNATNFTATFWIIYSNIYRHMKIMYHEASFS